MIIDLSKGHPGGNKVWMIDTDFTVDQIGTILGPEDRVGTMVVNKGMTATYVRNSTGWVPVVIGSGGGSYVAGNGIDIASGIIKTKIDGDTIKFNSNGQMYANTSSSSDIFMATYNTTSYTDINTAYEAGKEIIVSYTVTTGGPVYYGRLVVVSDGRYGFQIIMPQGMILLIVTSSGWTTESEESPQIFMATYGETTYADIKQAYDDGKFIYVYVPGTSSTAECYAPLGKYFAATGTFFFPTATYEGYIVQYFCQEMTGWGDERQQVQSKLTAGTGITISDNVISATGGGGSYLAVQYDTTTFAEIKAAYDAGKPMFCVYEGETEYYTGALNDYYYNSETDCGAAFCGVGVGTDDNGQPVTSSVQMDIYYDEQSSSFIWQYHSHVIGGTLFWAIYGETHRADLYTELNAGRLCVCKYNNYIYTCNYHSTNEQAPVMFYNYDGTTMRYVKCSGDTWESGTIATGDIFWATYNTSTYTEITNALNNGKSVMCKYNNYIYQYATTGLYDSVYFTTVLFGQSISPQVRVIALEDGVWSERTGDTVIFQPKLTAGTGINITNNVISATGTADSKVELVTYGDSSTYDTIKAYIDAGKIVFCQVNNYESSGYNLLLRVDWWNASTIQFTNTAYGGASTWSNAVQFRCNLTSSGWGSVEMIHIGAEMESDKVKELEERIAQLEELLN